MVCVVSRLTYVSLRLWDKKMQSLCAPFYLEKLFKFEYATFTTEVTLWVTGRHFAISDLYLSEIKRRNEK
jgi:hypothetical protein